ncbi:MAG: hypothetical protein AAB617_01590 [Patescibacteria group bacterium]
MRSITTRVAIGALALLCFSTIAASAQNPVVSSTPSSNTVYATNSGDKTYLLDNLSTNGIGKTFTSDANASSCGDYFVVSGNPQKGGIFTFSMSDQKVTPWTTAIMLLAIDKLHVTIDDTQTAPRGNIFVNSNGQVRILLRLTRAEYTKSPCLPSPLPLPTEFRTSIR